MHVATFNEFPRVPHPIQNPCTNDDGCAFSFRMTWTTKIRRTTLVPSPPPSPRYWVKTTYCLLFFYRLSIYCRRPCSRRPSSPSSTNTKTATSKWRLQQRKQLPILGASRRLSVEAARSVNSAAAIHHSVRGTALRRKPLLRP